MNILIKTTLRNIIGKPFRSFLVIFSIFVCTAAALFCFDLAICDKIFMDSMFSMLAGNADINVVGEHTDLSKLPSDFPEYDYLGMRALTDIRYNDIEGEYYIVSADRLRITATDIDAAARMDFIDAQELGDMQIIITQAYANAYDYQIGDTLVVHDKHHEPVELEVVNIVPTGTLNMIRRGKSGIVNDYTGDILFCGEYQPSTYVINIMDDSKIAEAMEILKSTFPDARVSRLSPSESSLESNSELLGFMILLFAIAFLLVIFITASLCQRIVAERMSYIGTLRSLGLSARATGLILLIENVFYALIGSVPASVIYVATRKLFIGQLFTYNRDGVMTVLLPPMSIWLILCVILGSVLIECIIPLRAQLKALKVSIRDIIFDNRDTEYKFSRFGITLGIILALTGIVTFFFRTNVFVASACLISTVLAVSFLFPLLLRKITTIIQDSSRKNDQEKWAIAAVEAGTRKSAVGSGILSATTSAMCIIVFTIAVSIMGYFGLEKYDCDVVVDTTRDSTFYSFTERMDGVTDTEILYCSSDDVNISGIKTYTVFYGMPECGFRMFTGFSEVPDGLENGTILLENGWASRNNLNAGDEITLTFNENGVVPIVKVFTVAGLFKNQGSASTDNTVILSEDDYISIFHDTPGQLLIRCDDPDFIASEIKKYGVGLYSECKTVEEIRAEEAEGYSSMVKIFVAVIGVALGMTAIGMISNQLIGFEGRKKECAVMLSTAMSRETLTGILFRESLLSAAVSSTTGLLVGSVLLYVIKSALQSSQSLYLPIHYKPVYMLLMWLGMLLLFALTVLFPIRSLKKMKISEQIKCE